MARLKRQHASVTIEKNDSKNQRCNCNYKKKLSDKPSIILAYFDIVWTVTQSKIVIVTNIQISQVKLGRITQIVSEQRKELFLGN